MKESHRPDLAALAAAYDAVDADARGLVGGLSEELGTWSADAASWSVAQCLDHLATGNRVYLAAMQPAAEAALEGGRLHRRPAQPGPIGRWFVRRLEPPVNPRFRTKAPRKIEPRVSPSLHDAATRFLTSLDEVRAFLWKYENVDLAGVRFPNPLVRGVRFSLATGLHVLAAHARRHLWQAHRVCAAAQRR
jgi:hypothetical protein